MSDMKTKAWKEKVFDIISKDDGDNRASRIFDLLIMALIVLSIVSIVLESFDSLISRYRDVFSAFEAFTVAVFTLEYILRIWTADLLYPEARRPRLRYMVSFMAIIDLLAILPFYLPFLSSDFHILRMMRLLRLFRLLRVFKMGRYVEALQTVVQVIRSSTSRLVIALMLCSFVMLFSAIIMYTVENPVQPERFPNVIASLWWAICTLTTVGYGDVYPVTTIGRFFASVISLVGIGIIAIPTGIIAAGFTAALNKNNRAGSDDPRHYCPYCGHHIGD